MSDSCSRPAGCALVTGASRGIGKVVALRLAQQGYWIGVNFRAAREQAEEVVRVIKQSGGRAVALQADVGIEDEASGLVSRVESELGPVDVLINNAGITRDRLVLQMSEEDWDATWQINLAGARAAARRALDSMQSRHGGRIVNLSSVVAATGNAGQANYAAAKAAVLGLTRELAVAGAPYGVCVNCVIPGYILTDATAHLSDDQRAAWMQRIPMRRPAGPEDVAEVVTFLVRREAWYLTGQCIAVDGGLLAAAGGGLAS